jgi:hypothetical protein
MGAILRLVRGFGALPPHECAYGMQLAKIEELSDRVGAILSLECFDPRKTEIEVSSLGGFSGLRGLTRYCAEVTKESPNREALLSSLKEIEKMQPVQQAATQLVERLVQYRDDLRDEASQDEMIVFIKYGLKDPAELDAMAQDVLGKIVERVDTATQFQKFSRGHCPPNFLAGNINIYPRLIENTAWYHLVNLELADPTRPILELRFMGLGGVFIFILDQLEATLGYKFFHLDGESIDADRQEMR